MRKLRLKLIALAAILILFSLPVLADEWSKSYSIKGTADVNFELDDGSVTVSGWHQNQVDVRVTTKGRGFKPGDLRVIESQNGDSVSIRIVVPSHWLDWSTGERWVRAELRVPMGLKLHARTGDGSVRLDGVKGTVRAISGDGSISARSLDGDLDAETGDGSVQVEGRFDGLRLRTGDGSIVATAGAGSRTGNGWEANTGDGSITLGLPSGFACDLDAHTGDGSINTDLPLTVRALKSKNHLVAKMNGGGPPLRLRTGDGSITIRGQ